MKILTSAKDIHEFFSSRSDQVCWGYTRVSSDKQEDGESFDTQARTIEAYCAENGLGEPVIVQETASAAKRMFALPAFGVYSETKQEEACPRPMLMALFGHLLALRPEEEKQLVVWKLDRVSRVGDEAELIYQLLGRSRVTLHSTFQGENHTLTGGSDPTKTLMRQIFAAFAQYERAVIEARMTAGRETKAARGGFIGGRPTFGYTVRDNELVIFPQEAKVVRHILHLSEHGCSLRQISDMITSDPQYNLKTFSHARVGRVIRNRKLYEGWYTDHHGVVHHRPDLNIFTSAQEESNEHELQ